MTKKLYICKECGYVFPIELFKLIENKVQVFCERCGTPFTLEGIDFKERIVQKKIGKRQHVIPKKYNSTFDEIIQFLNNISYIPILLFSIFVFIYLFEIIRYPNNWFEILSKQLLLGAICLLICLHDIKYISPKIKEKRYDEIIVDSICWGILGSIIFGIGAIILIKGVFIFLIVIFNSKNRNLRAYDYGLMIKNSLNNLSAKAGFIIVLFALYGIFAGGISILKMPMPPGGINLPPISMLIVPLITFIALLSIIIIVLLIDLKLRNEIKEKQEFNIVDSGRTIFIGVISTIFYSAGIFILLKGILLFFLFIGKPSEISQSIPIKEKNTYYPPPPIAIEQPKRISAEKEVPHEIRPTTLTQHETPPIRIKQEKKVEIKPNLEKSAREIKKEFKLKIHESLLPIKDEKDKKLVKQYFSKIFTVLSKDLRKQINNLKIPKKEKRKLLKELVFLTREEQVKYIEAIIILYKKIPKKLIERIKQLPNVKPEHYEKIINQLKYMNFEEQISFVQFLEENA
ncbi:MAG: hypothetical protein ACTSUT_00350 [Promethearchaeota archaeon]